MVLHGRGVWPLTAKPNLTTVALLALATVNPMTAQNQCATEWVATFMENHVQGKMILRESFEKCRKLAVKHYVSTNSLARAKFVSEFEPDLDDLAALVAIQRIGDRASKTETSLERVIQKYIVKTSSRVADSHPE